MSLNLLTITFKLHKKKLMNTLASGTFSPPKNCNVRGLCIINPIPHFKHETTNEDGDTRGRTRYGFTRTQ